jgi:hypothetical protein
MIPLNQLHPAQIAVGPCPVCGRLDLWLNNVPLTAYCFGNDRQEHKEWSKQIPGPYNPYLTSYDAKAAVHEIPAGVIVYPKDKPPVFVEGKAFNEIVTSRAVQEYEPIAEAIKNADRAVSVLYPDPEDITERVEIGIKDTLANLLHYCNAHGVDFGYELSCAQKNYAEELREAQIVIGEIEE